MKLIRPFISTAEVLIGTFVGAILSVLIFEGITVADRTLWSIALIALYRTYALERSSK